MIVCIPSLDEGGAEAAVSPHFGRAPAYTLYDTTAETFEIVPNDSNHRGGTRSPPAVVGDTGADVLLCGNIGNRAVDRFESMGIEVFCGATGTVAEALEAWETDNLNTECGHEHHHGHAHDHQHGHDHEHNHDHQH